MIYFSIFFKISAQECTFPYIIFNVRSSFLTSYLLTVTYTESDPEGDKYRGTHIIELQMIHMNLS